MLLNSTLRSSRKLKQKEAFSTVTNILGKQKQKLIIMKLNLYVRSFQLSYYSLTIDISIKRPLFKKLVLYFPLSNKSAEQSHNMIFTLVIFFK